MIVFTLAAVLVLGFVAYQSPRVRELFESPPPRTPAAPETVTSKPAAPPARVAQPKADTAPSSLPEPRPKAAEKSPSPPPPIRPVPKPTVSNSEVSSVLMGIFRARQIYGVSLSVSDAEIEVAGEVTSEQQRKQVLDTIEKAREHRRVVATGLKVRQP